VGNVGIVRSGEITSSITSDFQGITFALQVDPVIDGAIGSPFPGCDVRLIDDDGNDVPVDTPGELLFRGNPKTNNNCSRTHCDEGIF
jgi:acyl-coenzyme A synthetase/AMP-(fatty) acid ligase